jgi:hypothetical protein
MILFARMWRGRVIIDSMRTLPDEDTAINYAVKLCKRKDEVGLDPILEANFIQAWEVFEGKEPIRVKRFPARVQDKLGS